MQHNITWEEYRKKVKASTPDHGEKNVAIQSAQLSVNMGDLMKLVLIQSIEEDIDLKVKKTIALGNLLRSLAVIEIISGLPSHIYHGMIDTDFPVNNSESCLWPILKDLHTSVGDIGYHMDGSNKQDLQYELNTLFAVILDLAIEFEVSIVDCMISSLINAPAPPTPQNKVSEDYHAMVKEAIEKSGKKELLFDAMIENGEYKRLFLEFDNRQMVFDNGDVLVDHFKAVNFMTEDLPQGEYKSNYSNTIRDFFKAHPNVRSGFIVGEDLINAREFLEKNKSSFYGLVVNTNGYKPCLYHENMKSLWELLDYITERTKK
jgi:hypothetical protein